MPNIIHKNKIQNYNFYKFQKPAYPSQKIIPTPFFDFLNNYCKLHLKPYNNSKEFEHIKDSDYKYCIGRMKYSVPELLKLTHFNKENPEHKNVKINNIKSKYLEWRKLGNIRTKRNYK